MLGLTLVPWSGRMGSALSEAVEAHSRLCETLCCSSRIGLWTCRASGCEKTAKSNIANEGMLDANLLLSLVLQMMENYLRLAIAV